MRKEAARDRTFAFRDGVRLRDSVLACDAPAGQDLTFISNASVPVRPGRRKVLLTAETLALLGSAGERLRPHALVGAYGRPFSLGELRLELFPSGHLLGAASLRCELGGRRAVYAGVVRPGPAVAGTTPCEVREADALCIDATFGSPAFRFPDRAEALAAVRRFVETVHAAGRAAVVLAPPLGTALELATELRDGGLAVRGHRIVLEVAARHRRAGVAAPRILQFAGRLGAREVLLWPVEAREARVLGALADPAFALVSGWAADSAALRRFRADVGISLSDRADHAALVAYVRATGAGEVGVVNGCAEELAETLRRAGHKAYVLGPPRQMDLFRG